MHFEDSVTAKRIRWHDNKTRSIQALKHAKEYSKKTLTHWGLENHVDNFKGKIFKRIWGKYPSKYSVNLLTAQSDIFLKACWWYLTHYGLVTPYGDIKAWWTLLRKWLVALWHQAIICTYAEFSWARFFGIHLRAISPRVHKLIFCIIRLKITITSPRGQWVKHWFM